MNQTGQITGTERAINVNNSATLPLGTPQSLSEYQVNVRWKCFSLCPINQLEMDRSSDLSSF